MSSSDQPAIYIVYNAKATLLGKFNYVYRKFSSTDPENAPACAACELTHGPSLRLAESTDWAASKDRIQNVTVIQVHTDERPVDLYQWMEENGVSTPTVIGEVNVATAAGDARFRLLLTSDDLAQVRLDHEQFLQLLALRGKKAGIPITVKSD